MKFYFKKNLKYIGIIKFIINYFIYLFIYYLFIYLFFFHYTFNNLFHCYNNISLKINFYNDYLLIK